jgi:hypothetical protein
MMMCVWGGRLSSSPRDHSSLFFQRRRASVITDERENVTEMRAERRSRAERESAQSGKREKECWMGRCE